MEDRLCENSQATKMKDDPFLLMNLPAEIIEEILLYLVLPDRKNIRLTCKWLYKLCNSVRICKTENIIWSENLMSCSANSTIYSLGRGYYNLVVNTHKTELEKSSILPFLEVHGAKVRSLSLNCCSFSPELLESLMKHCGGSCSLYLNHAFPCVAPDFIRPISKTVIQSPVTYKELILPDHQPYNYFHRMVSPFSNLKSLNIITNALIPIVYHVDSIPLCFETNGEYEAIFNDIMRSGSNLETLKLNVPLCHLIAKSSQFFNALKKLKVLSINFHGMVLREPIGFYSSLSNIRTLTTLELAYLNLSPADLSYLLENTGLLHLKLIFNTDFNFNLDNFRILMLSKLKTLSLKNSSVLRYNAPREPMIIELPREANTTLSELCVSDNWDTPEWLPPQFLPHLRGLVHLTISSASDFILQNIFKYQENLRSLVIYDCGQCSIDGFCGKQDDPDRCSIGNLRKLEHLSIQSVSRHILQSDDFKAVFNFSRLKYLRIAILNLGTEKYSDEEDINNGVLRLCAGIPSYLYENLTNLEALRLGEIALPSRRTLSSLFTKMKRLNYLRYDVGVHHGVTVVAYINTKHFSIVADYEFIHALGLVHFDQELDRMVILNGCLRKTLFSPKIGSYKVWWITA